MGADDASDLLLQILNFNHAFLNLKVSKFISIDSNSKFEVESFYQLNTYVLFFFVYAI
jgi:hypothetical protein